MTTVRKTSNTLIAKTTRRHELYTTHLWYANRVRSCSRLQYSLLTCFHFSHLWIWLHRKQNHKFLRVTGCSAKSLIRFMSYSEKKATIVRKNAKKNKCSLIIIIESVIEYWVFFLFLWAFSFVYVMRTTTQAAGLWHRMIMIYAG